MSRIICTVTNDLTYDQRMIRICTSLARAGYEVNLVGRLRHSSKPLKKEDFKQNRLKCWFNQGKLFYLEYNLRLFFYLLSHPFDIVCSVDLDTILPGLWVSRLKGKICVFDAHEYFTEVPEVIRRPRVQRIWEWVACRTIPRLDYAYTVGESLAQLFQQQYGTVFSVIRNVPFRQTEHIEATPPLKPILLYQGVLNESRGLEQMIEAMLLLEEAELWLAGEGDLSEKLRRMVKKLNLEEKVKFLGYLPPEELRKVTLQATIGLNLLENNGLSYYYSLANKAFDYIQAGLPSMHMDFPEYRYLQEMYDVFVLLPDLKTATIVATVRQLIRDRDRYRQLHENCLRAREELNWEHEEEKLLSFYQGILNRDG